MRLHSTLEAIEKRSGLDRREGPALWAYKLTPAEYSELHGALKIALARGEESRAVAAAFCMVAANHFCRTHDGGPWSWSSIFEETGWRHGVGARLYDIVETGLRYWGIETVLSTEHRRYYHRTLACQGGLPLRLLARKDASQIQAFFRRLVQSCELYEQPAAELVAALAGGLPQTLRNEVVYALAAQLVDCIVSLRRLLPLTSVDPLRDLDAIEPGWRNRVPVRVEDLVAEKLLRGLLSAPSAGERAAGTSIVDVALMLRVGPSLTLIRAPRLTRSASESELKQLFGLAELPPYFHLAALTPDGTRRAIGSAHQVDGAESFRLMPDVPGIPIRRGPGLLGHVRIVASIGTTDLGLADPAGGQAIPEDLPWVLRGTQLSGDVAVRAFGSARAAADSMLLVLPPDAQLVPDAGATIEPIPGALPERRTLVRLKGAASFTTADGDRCRFQTGAAEQDTAYRLAGRLQGFAFRGSEVWQGPPRVLRVTEQREELVRAERIQWRPRYVPGAEWRPWATAPVGDVWIRVVEDGETVFRTTSTIVPSDLSVGIQHRSGGRGVISLASRQLRGARVRTGGIECQATNREGSVELAVETRSNPPPTLELELLLEGASEARISVPCPIDVVRFVGFDGTALPNGERRAVDRLGTVRAVAVQTRPQDLVVEARLAGYRAWRVIGQLASSSKSGSVLELSLERVQSTVAMLLAESLSLDAKAELRIVPRGGTLTPGFPLLCVARHDTRLVPVRRDSEVQQVVLDEASVAVLGEGAAALLRVDMRPLDQIDAAPVELTEDAPGAWLVPWGDLAPGPWLIMGWQGEWPRVRPLLVTKPGEPTAELDRLQRSIRVQPEDVRLGAIEEVLAALEADYGAPEWAGVESMAGTLDRVPAMTFDVVRAVARRPLSAAMLAIRTSASASLWTGLQGLPFLWGTVPVRDWIAAIRRVARYAAAHPTLVELYGSRDAASAALLEPFFEECPKRARFVSTVLELAHRVERGLPPVHGNPVLDLTVKVGPALLDAQLRGERDLLTQRNASRRWPTVGLPELVSQRVWSLIERHERIDTFHPYQFDVVAAPAVAAGYSVLAEPLDGDAIFYLRLLRYFDPEWFGTAHAMIMTRLLAHELRASPEGYDDVR